MRSNLTRRLRLLCVTLMVIIFSTACGGGDNETASMKPGAIQHLVITIDVEALPARQSESHVQRLIYGNFPGLGRAGIIDMMDIADRRNVRLTFFLDVLEESIYPKEIEAVAKLIVARGHDLQLHTHPDIMPDAFFHKLGTVRKSTNEFSETEADALFSETRSIVSKWDIPAFIAYRAGSYRYSEGLVRAMPRAGILFSYNYNIKGVSQVQLNLDNIPIFQWDHDVVEVPVSYINSKSNHTRFDDSTYINSQDVQVAYQLIAQFQHQWDSTNILVMMLHSWSFLDLNPETGYFEYKDSAKLVMFDRFLASLPNQVKIVTATELSELIAAGAISVPGRMNTADVFRR